MAQLAFSVERTAAGLQEDRANRNLVEIVSVVAGGSKWTMTCHFVSSFLSTSSDLAEAMVSCHYQSM